MQMKHYRRDWLNKKKGTAFIESTSATYFPKKKNVPGHVSASLTIADCSRLINLDFDAFDKEDVDERVAKLDMIRTHLDALRDALLEARPGLMTRKQAAALDRKQSTEFVSLEDL